MYQAANAATLPPIAVEQAAPVLGVVRREWRSPQVRLSEYAGPLPPYTPPPHTHPIATLGTIPEAMRTAHADCLALPARLGEDR